MGKLRKALPPLSSLLPFEAAARLESITQAGDELGLTQAAISRQIKALEDNLGTQLFERRNRAVYLTQQGRELRQVVSAALESIASCATRLRDTRKSNEVVLFAELCEGLYWVMPRLSKFYQRHPNIDVRVSVSTKPITESTEYFDVVFQTTGRESGWWKLVFTAPDEVFPVCSPKYLEERHTPLPLAELPQHHLLHHKIYPQDWIDWDDWLERLGFDSRVGYQGTVFDSYPLMIQAVLEGHGICLGWKQTTQRMLQTGALVRPFAESLLLSDGLSIYQHPHESLRPEVEALLTWLKDELLSNQ